MSLADKMIVANMGVQVAGAILGPEEEDAREVHEANTRWVGSFYGQTAEGESAPPPPGHGGLLPPEKNESAGSKYQAPQDLFAGTEARRSQQMLNQPAPQQSARVEPARATAPKNAPHEINQFGIRQQQFQNYTQPLDLFNPQGGVRYV